MPSITARLQRYPKFVLLVLSFIAAYALFSVRDTLPFQQVISSAGYAGIFVVGMAYSYGFTAAPATALLLLMGSEYSSINLLFAALVGGLGSLASDLLLFSLIRHGFADEAGQLVREPAITKSIAAIPKRFRHPLLLAVAYFIIGSPLPDELGISLLAMTKKVSIGSVSVLSFALNTVGILVVLLIGTGM